MKLTKKQELELMQVYDTWWHSYLNGDIDTYDSFLDEDFRFVGSTGEEEFLNRKDTTAFFKATADQLAGKAKLENVNRSIEVFDQNVLITDLADTFILDNNVWAYYARFRFTTLLRKTKKGWRFFYQHFSTPDIMAQEGETLGLDKISAENLKLRNAIKRRTVELELKNRELEIEASLERVRLASLEMNQSEELLDVIMVISDQLRRLGIKFNNVSFGLNNEDEDYTFWAAVTGESKPIKIKVPYIDHPMLNISQARKNKREFLAEVFAPEVHKQWIRHLLKHAELPFLSKNAEARLENCPLARSVAILPNIFLVLVNYKGIPFSDFDNSIITRFGQVFEQSYRRFLDLQKAEEQTREAQIELALERVRARTMAMQESKDLHKIANVVLSEMEGLDIQMNSAMIHEYRDDSKDMYFWVAAGGVFYPDIVHLPYYNNQFITRFNKAREKGKEIFSDVMIKAEKIKKNWRHFFKHVAVPPDRQKYLLSTSAVSRSTAFFENTAVSILRYDDAPFSESQNVILKRFGQVFQQAYTRFLDLQKVERQAREAQIEAALERVRSKTMAMHNSEDVEGIVITLFDEVMKLGIDETIRCGIGILEDCDGMQTWSTNVNSDGETNSRMGILDMTIHPMLIGLKKAWENGSNGYSYEFDEKDVFKYYKALNIDPGYPFNANLDTLPKKNFHNSFFFSSGIIFSFTENQISEASCTVLSRFADVFGQSYRRYLDLRKAESQAKEAQLEAALEKIRARTMAMQSSDELRDAANLLFLEIQALGINAWSCGYNILSNDKTSSECWMSSEGELQDPFPLYFTEEASFIEMGTFLKSEADFFVQELEGKELEQHYDYMKSLPELEATFKHVSDAGLTLPTYQINHLCKFSQGFLLFITYEPVPDSHETFKRFTKVFEQTYTRFLDLQKSEKQSKEARIELALERVRASSMAMHQSEQIAETAEVLFEQFDFLGVVPDRISIAIYNEKKRAFELWATDQRGTNVDHGHDFSIDEPTCVAKTYKAWREKRSTFIVDLKGKELKDWISYVKNEAKMEIDESNFKGRRLQNFALFSQGALLLSSHQSITDDVMSILSRFSKVFEQTYTRFLDLQKAEKQAREAVKHASVDRVRAEIASMRTAKDLKRITPLVWNELNTLDVPFIRCGVFIMDEERREVRTHLSTPDGKAIASFQLSFENTEPLTQLLPHWLKKEMYTDYWDKSTFIESTKILMQQGAITSTENYITENPPANLHLHFLPFLQGMLYVGSEVLLTEDELNLVQNLADAFSTAYSRYEDFNKLELANKKIEKTLMDLKQTQSQLIQSEKMASLGELTAGIAHEIQNPLNFVNNFSEVSQELMKEMKEEIIKGDLEEANEIGIDIEQNLEKITNHGKRASDIVKGMLQHSRSNKGVQELTDINALVDEYLRLAYHGLRAKDKSFNAKLETEYDDVLEKVNVIPQDIGRVILNLITNAFYAVRERGNSTPANYGPLVIVQTHKNNNKVEISVKDNGNGIPKNVLDKIFQPFFTTKPTGKGTGLGLSLSYDIIKAHGGDLKVITKEGEGSEFLIQLPLLKNNE